MKKNLFLLSALIICQCISAQRSTELLENWKFTNYDFGAAFQEHFDDNNWKDITIPHDWAVKEDFDFTHDIQLTMVIQDGETQPRYRTGRTGALPYVGIGWYRTKYDVSSEELKQKVQLLFDGAMSNAKVYVNGKYVGERPFGYISFYFDITKFLKPGTNSIAVRLENFDSQSRWYPGAGLYRKVSIIKTNTTHVKTWGTFVTTPEISKKKALVNAKVELLGSGDFTVKNEIYDPNGKLITQENEVIVIKDAKTLNHNFQISKPKLWSIETPNLYTLKTTVLAEGKAIDSYKTTFGIRSIRFEIDGFYLNDKKVKLKGVNMHHDFGPVGAAFYPELFVRQMKKMKEMGVNAIRFSHNPPAPEALDICDKMGILAIDEAFDEWQIGKTLNGYSKQFDLWSKKDLTDMILRDRNHPSIIMWSIGNEIMEQYRRDPNGITKYLNDIVKSLDTTRATTAGFNSANNALESGMASTVDVTGFNYKPGIYHKIKEHYPNLKFYASETGGALSTRNSYKFPVVFDTVRNARGASANVKLYKDGQPGNYENTNVPWGYAPFKEFAAQDYNDFVYGEFVWTGYDYLGEPSPYHTAKSRSSYFAPVDMVGLEKDKFYLYQSEWNDNKETLHVFPHWTLPEMENKTLPVVCYTTYDKAELFVNGKSYGIKTKQKPETPEFLAKKIQREASGGTTMAQLKAYAIVWDNVSYEPGEVKVVAYNKKGKKVDEVSRVTSQKPASIEIKNEVTSLSKGEVAVYVVSVLDKNGNLCVRYNENMKINVDGAAEFLASGNGNPTNVQNLSKPERRFFNGQAVIYAKSNAEGVINIAVQSKNLSKSNSSLIVK
ncbi:glycoside hydrolase family 2 TIM barrel-domain containing protein [Seonamhaeicola marinus]|uniref:Glycoside hydrolase family 2 protein n=1 Tax=Seonamhaeicola marinus TaxID=1912246 RepID=A0A5D0HSI3_9FLAO|nr:glycoside hydrolase family 2 TIM barrel-domain containing protein [Seonamhaeicola marinus]TYA73910.1 glycoside hydrolase family 2 protein [Seonamhaeicola marinus]